VPYCLDSGWGVAAPAWVVAARSRRPAPNEALDLVGPWGRTCVRLRGGEPRYRPRMADTDDDRPRTDDRHPAAVVTAMVDHVLDLAATWTAWDGTPRTSSDGRTYTPHKAVRRVADHLVDHLAEMEARLAGVPTIPDHWHASAITTGADLAPFTAEDLDEARSRLTRLAQIWDVRLRTTPTDELDVAAPGQWTLRQVAFHLEESSYYADSVGRLP
jgi:hypothetical protein